MNTINKENHSNFEIYTKNPETKETGWDIHFVTVLGVESEKEAREKLKEYPLFDCVIMHNWTEKMDSLHTRLLHSGIDFIAHI